MLEKKIIDYAKQCEPREMCGFVVFDGQEKIFIACENIAEDKENHFEISSDDFLKASEYDGIIALVHSHPNGEPVLSTMDRQAQMFSNLDFWLVCHDEIHEFPVIAIGADAENEESQVIISANKFVIADPNSRELKTPFLVSTQNGQSRVALDGDLIVSNSITGDKIQANTSITSPTIKGGPIDIGNGVFTVNPNGHITANSGVFKGRIEATDGFFGGTVYADKIVGDVLKFYSTLGKRVAGSNRVAKIVYDNIIIPAFSRERTVYLCPIMLVAAGKAGYH